MNEVLDRLNFWWPKLSLALQRPLILWPTGAVAATRALVVGRGRLLQLHEHVEQGVGTAAAVPRSLSLIRGSVEPDVLGGDGCEAVRRCGRAVLRPRPGLGDEVEGVLPHGGDACPLPVGLKAGGKVCFEPINKLL